MSDESALSPSEEVRAWEELFENPAWRLLNAAISEQISTRTNIVLHETLTPDAVYDREKLRGERAGLELAVQLALDMYETAQIERERVIKEMENEQTDENSV